ncbi:MAG TPA: hypothetical protein VFC19_19150 [Candidatus Limnocylindrales bacterium]|nr:hypothetical protein [Candidatus Limnocylindrales bacterium]
MTAALAPTDDSPWMNPELLYFRDPKAAWALDDTGLRSDSQTDLTNLQLLASRNKRGTGVGPGETARRVVGADEKHRTLLRPPGEQGIMQAARIPTDVANLALRAIASSASASRLSSRRCS